jgi:hypothetical protein
MIAWSKPITFRPSSPSTSIWCGLTNRPVVIDETHAMASHGISFSAPQIDIDKLREWKEGVVKRLTAMIAWSKPITFRPSSPSTSIWCGLTNRPVPRTTVTRPAPSRCRCRSSRIPTRG